MANVYSIAQRLFGVYTQSGVFSFEFVFEKGGGPTLLEFPFLLPPQSYNVSESWIAREQKTITGGYIPDFGNDFKKISFSADLWFYYAGFHSNGGEIPNGWAGRGQATNEGTGQAEFMKLRYLLSRFRDHIRFSNTSIFETEPLSLEGFPEVDLLRAEIDKRIGKGESILSNNVKLIFNAYDYGDHFYVKVDDFSYAFSSDDPHTVKIQCSLLAYKKDSNPLNRRINNLTQSKPNAGQLLKKAIGLV